MVSGSLAVGCGLLCSGALEERCRGENLRGVRARESATAEEGTCVLFVQDELQVLVDLREGRIHGIAGQE